MTSEEAYLKVVEGWLRENRGIVFVEGAVDDLCKRVAEAIDKAVFDFEHQSSAEQGITHPDLISEQFSGGRRTPYGLVGAGCAVSASQ